jgi:PAS domain S-box-containing protein
MKIRAKVFLTVFVVFGVLFFGVSKIITRIENDNFRKLENNDASENIKRVQVAVENKSDDLAVKLTDWSQWDDTYAFVQDKNQGYIDSNLGANTLVQLRLNFIMIKNSAGDVIYEKYIKTDGSEMPFPQGLETLFSDKRMTVMGQGDPKKKMTGLMDTPEGHFVLAVQPVTSSDASAPPRGFIAFGYIIDNNFIGSLSKATVLKLDYASFSDVSKNESFSTAGRSLSLNSPTYIDVNPAPEVINGFVIMSDIFGNPCIIFRAQIPRDINKIGVANTKRLNILLVGIEIFEIAVVLILFEIFVLRKIGKLVEGVQLVGSKDSNEERLEVQGKDEFSKLSSEINKMLDAIRSIKGEKKESEMRFIKIADSAPMMLWVSDSSNKMVYVNGKLMEFLGKLEQELMGDAWTSVIHSDDKERVLDVFQAASEKKEPFSLKYRVMDSKGNYRKILVQAVARRTPQKVFKGYIGTAVDITDFEESDHIRQEYESRIDQMNKVIMEHELKIEELLGGEQKGKLKKASKKQIV